MTTALITRDFNGSPIVFRADGWFNMTRAAQHFGKEVKHFWSLESTTQYLEAQAMVGNTDLWEANRGRYGGTWGHPKLAVFFARWLDVRFSVWCDAVIEDILKGAAEVAIVKPEESAAHQESRRGPSAFKRLALPSSSLRLAATLRAEPRST